MVTLMFFILAAGMLFGVILSYILALKMRFTKGIFALLLFFILEFVYMLLGIMELSYFKITGEIQRHHYSLPLSIFSFVVITFLLYTTWYSSNKLN